MITKVQSLSCEDGCKSLKLNLKGWEIQLGGLGPFGTSRHRYGTTCTALKTHRSGWLAGLENRGTRLDGGLDF